MGIAVYNYKLAESSPVACGQFKSSGEQRFAPRVFLVIEIVQSKPVRHVRFEVADNAARSQFSAQQFGKNLKVTWAVDKSRTRFSYAGQSDRHCVSITHPRPLKMRGPLDAVSLAKQLPDRDM